MFNWWLIAALILIAAVVLVVVRKRATASAGTGRPLTLVVGRFVAIAYAAVALVGTAISVIATLVNDAVAVSLPVQEFWPGTYPWITLQTGPTATVLSGGFTSADVLVGGLGPDARLLLAGGHALEGVTFVLIALAFALLCHRLLGGSPFRPVLARSVMVSAVTIAIGGIAWQICYGIGGAVASAQVLNATGWDSKLPSTEISDFIDSTLDATATGLPASSIGMTVEFWPLLLGLALAAVAIAFRYGERLQRDTEGLV